MMVVKYKLCPNGLKNNPNRPLKAMEFITVHCTGNRNATATARSHADYQHNGSGGAQASWHYTVDKDEIWQSFDDFQECWHAGDGSNGPGNYTSIGIEICVNDKAGFKQAVLNAAWLTAELLKKHNLTIDKVVQHNKWSGKDCPMELRSGEWGVTWNDFLAVVRDYYAPPVTQTEPTIPAMSGHEPSAWAKDAWNWARGLGITDGTNPQANATREQVVMLLYNYHKRKQ